jgi:SAM-dependent methyltransferase
MEDPADRIVGHYERHALSWDADRRAAGWIDKPSIERFLSFLPRGATVLDVGCGGGSPVALYMVAHGFHVTGVDSSRTSSRYAEPECRIRNGSSAKCALWPLVGDFKGYWPGTASFISGTKTSERCLRYLRCTPRHPPFWCSMPALVMVRQSALIKAVLYTMRASDASEYQALLTDSGFELIEHSINDPAKGFRIFWLARSR